MDQINKDMSEVFGKLGKSFGLKDLNVKIITFLYLEPEEVAMDDIATELGYSLASVSNALKMLESIGMCKQIKKPGSKRLYYIMEKDLLKININKLTKASDIYIEPAKNRIPGIINKYKSSKDEKTKKKLKIIEKYYKQLLVFESLMTKWKNDLREAL
ncbi:MAG: hypothetical protein ABIJ34_00875 [archaeon]